MNKIFNKILIFLGFKEPPPSATVKFEKQILYNRINDDLIRKRKRTISKSYFETVIRKFNKFEMPLSNRINMLYSSDLAYQEFLNYIINSEKQKQ